MAVTVLSLLIDLLQFHWLRHVGQLPPPRPIKFLAHLVNRILYFLPKLPREKNKKDELVKLPETLEIAEEKMYLNDWLELNHAISRVLFIIFLFVYCIGTIVLVNF